MAIFSCQTSGFYGVGGSGKNTKKLKVFLLCKQYVSTAVRINPKSAFPFRARSVQSAFDFMFTNVRLVRDLIKSMSLFRMEWVSNQSESLFYDYFTT